MYIGSTGNLNTGVNNGMLLRLLNKVEQLDPLNVPLAGTFNQNTFFQGYFKHLGPNTDLELGGTDEQSFELETFCDIPTYIPTRLPWDQGEPLENSTWGQRPHT
jgi:hypothetical protein